MKLFTGGIDKKLFAQFPKGSDLKNQKVIAKIFNPFGRGTWYIINSDPNDPDYLWAIVDLYEPEVGSVSRKELESVRIKPFNLKLERDMYFDEVNAQELYDGLLEGKRYAKGGYMEDGGETEGVDLFEDYEDQPQEVTAILSKYELEDNDYDVLEELLAELKEIGYTFEYGLDGEPYDLRKIGQKGKSEFYAKGGYMTKGEDYEYVNTFKRFNSNVPVPQDDFKKLVDAYHKQLSGDRLDVVKYDVLKQQMGNYLGHETIEEMEEYIEKTHEAHKYAKGGSIKEKADYVSNRNIKSITLTIDGKLMTIDGSSILDGVYVKKGTTQKAPRVQPKSVAAKISDLAFDSWEKFDIDSGSQIYASDDLQKKLNKDFKEKGIDEIFSKLDMAQRKKVADILTDNNDHSLRNYLALRGYLGKEERDMYVSLYEERKQRPVNLNPKNFPKVMAEGGRIGFEALSKKVAKRYEGKEVPTKYRSEYGSRYDKEEAKEVGDKVAAKVYRMQLGKK
jgi:hypothetical protein